MWLEIGEQVLARYHHTGRAGCVDLVAREDQHIEITVTLTAHLHRKMGHQLGSVDHQQGAVAVGKLGRFVHGIDDAGDVGDARDGDVVDPVLVLFQRLFHSIKVDAAEGMHRHPCRHMDDLAEMFPVRQVVGMVLHDRRDHHIPVGAFFA